MPDLLSQTDMETKPQREIVIEIERVRMIKKRAKTMLEHCAGCGKVSDVVAHSEAALLFETSTRDLFQFIKQHDCHYHLGESGDINLCVTSLIEQMQRSHKSVG